MGAPDDPDSGLRTRRAPHPTRADADRALLVAVRLSPVFLVLASTLVLSVLSVLRHERYESQGFDLGIFDQTIWGYSTFEVLPNTVKRVPNLLGDHFHPILFGLAPLYWLWDDVRVLLVAQAALISAASVPLYLWARTVLGMLPALCCQLAFLLFWGVSAGALADFHELAFAAPAISLALYGTLARRDAVLWVGVVAALLTKEDIALTVVGLAVYVLVVQRRMKLGLALAAVGVAWFSAVVWLIMPALAGGSYAYWMFVSLGQSPSELVAELVRSPQRGVEVLFDRWEKVRTQLALFGAWLLLPLCSPIVLVAGPVLVELFWSSNPAHWSTNFQYWLPVAPILAFATVDAIARLGRVAGSRQRTVVNGLAAAVVVAAIVSFAIVSPIDRPAVSAAQAAEIDACLGTIPDEASVAASDRLVPHLSHRRAIYPLWVRQDQQYLAIDRRAAPGRRMLRRLERPDNVPVYSRACSGGDVVVLRMSQPAPASR